MAKENGEGYYNHAKIKELRKRRRPVNILLVGPHGVGKSTLINAMFGEDVVEVGHGPRSHTTKVRAYKGEYLGVAIRIYDTPGFRDNKGKREYDILLEIAAKRGKFDLILICIKLGDSVNQRRMFSELASHLNEEMWIRTAVVLTFANLEGEVKIKVDEDKSNIVEILSKSVINKKVLEKIPYRIAGLKGERKLPITNDWLKTLWETCIDRSSDETRHFLTFYARNLRIIEAATVLALVGAGIGAAVGSVVPVVGTVIGAGVGGLVGAGVSFFFL